MLRTVSKLIALPGLLLGVLDLLLVIIQRDPFALNLLLSDSAHRFQIPA